MLEDGDRFSAAEASFCGGSRSGETTGIAGGTAGPAAGAGRYEDGAASKADDAFAAHTSGNGATSSTAGRALPGTGDAPTVAAGFLPSTGGLALPAAGLQAPRSSPAA